MTSTNTYTPYFYIIKHVPSGKLYAGSKFGKDSDPTNFMTEDGYKTSSSRVAKLIEETGLSSFEIVTLMTEDQCGVTAYDYETRFLKENDISADDNWLNLHNNDSKFLPHNHPKVKDRMLEKYGVLHCTQNEEILHKCLSSRKRNLQNKLDSSTYYPLILGIPKWVRDRVMFPTKKKSNGNWKWLSEENLREIYERILVEYNKKEIQELLHLSDAERKYRLSSMSHLAASANMLSKRTAKYNALKDRQIIKDIYSFPSWFTRGKTAKNLIWLDQSSLEEIYNRLKTEWDSNKTEFEYMTSLTKAEFTQYTRRLSLMANRTNC